jgi:hypothetical protein
VELIGQRNEETAQLFSGSVEKPAATPAMTAQSIAPAQQPVPAADANTLPAAASAEAAKTLAAGSR